jgi:hypothetical protein
MLRSLQERADDWLSTVDKAGGTVTPEMREWARQRVYADATTLSRLLAHINALEAGCPQDGAM